MSSLLLSSTKDLLKDIQANISFAVYLIEKNDVEKFKQFVPSRVPYNARSVNRNILLKDIALYMKRMDIYNYILDLEKEKDLKRIAKFDTCFKNIDKMNRVILQDDVDTLMSMLRKPEEIFCNDNGLVNRQLYEDFENKAFGECKEYLQVLKPTFFKRSNVFSL